MIRAFSTLALAGLLIILGACGDSSSSNNATGQEDEQPVRVQDFRLVEGARGERQVMGTLQNTTSREIENAQVQISLFDADNVQIESMNVTVEDIPASGEVDFKQSLNTGKNVQGARVKSVLVM